MEIDAMHSQIAHARQKTAKHLN